MSDLLKKGIIIGLVVFGLSFVCYKVVFAFSPDEYGNTDGLARYQRECPEWNYHSEDASWVDGAKILPGKPIDEGAKPNFRPNCWKKPKEEIEEDDDNNGCFDPDDKNYKKDDK